MSYYVEPGYWEPGYSTGEGPPKPKNYDTWGGSWGKTWLNSWGKLAKQDTHDGGSEYYYKWWKKQHEKKKPPTLEEVIEAVQENPREAIKAVPEARAKFKEVDYSAVKQNADLALFIARELLITLELRRIDDENDENDAIMLLLM